MQIAAAAQMNVNQNTPVTTQTAESLTVPDSTIPAAASGTVQNTPISTAADTVTNAAINATVAKEQLNATNTVVNLAIQNLLKELTAMIDERQNLLDSLPENIQQTVTDMLENSTGAEISQGFAAILKSQRTSTDKIITLANVLENAAQVIDAQQAALENLPANVKQFLTNIRTLMMTQGEISELATKVVAEFNPIEDDHVAAATINRNDLLSTESAAGKTNSGAALNIAGDKLLHSIAIADGPESLIEKLLTVVRDASETSVPFSAEKTAVSEMKLDTSAVAKQPAMQEAPLLQENALPINDAESNLPTPSSSSAASAATHQEQQNVSLQPQMAAPALQVTSKMMTNLQMAIKMLKYPDQPFLRDVPLETRQQVTTLIENIQGQLDNFTDKITVLPEKIELYYENPRFAADVDGAVQNFVQLLEKAREDKNGLQQLMNTAVSFAPLFIQQAAEDSQLPNIWALLTLSHAAATEDTDADDLDKASRTLKEIAVSLQKGVQASTENGNEHTSATVSVPICFAEGTQPYPLYMHIYHQRQYSSAAAEKTKYETWLRICLVTQHIGNVECVFRLYDDNLLDVKIHMEAQEGVTSFREDVNALREKFEQSPLHLVGITVN